MLEIKGFDFQLKIHFIKYKSNKLYSLTELDLRGFLNQSNYDIAT